ncbi:odorant receptor 94b-like [Bombus bifarius]|uniref:Odorant receptor n=1 Tax=Bombus bifarius TaxID=103933 RepID=A0A6P8MZW0_9HYME|nr:odorant receptor 94b-like [Bombus bifarius]
MHILRWTFLLFTLCGCYPPLSWKTPLQKFLYEIYTVFSFLVLNSFLLSQILDMICNVENTDDFSDNFSVTVVVFVTCIKLFTILVYRANFLHLCNTLQREPFLPMNEEEFEILLKFEKITDWNTLGYMTLLVISDFFILVVSLLANFKNRKLAFRTWIPYEYSSLSTYLLTFLYQSLFTTICTFGCVASDSLYSGLLIHINCQFEILEHRLKNIESNQNYSVKLCVHHHDHIYKFGEMVNEEFKMIMLFQFCTSLSTICFNFYRITQIEMDSRFVGTLLYMACSLMQIFYYCWFSNEVKLKSLELSDMIFRTDWTSLNNNVKKAFLMLMRRAMRPIEFTSIYVISVNLESFMTLLKTSYSAFNFFQQSRES